MTVLTFLDSIIRLPGKSFFPELVSWVPSILLYIQIGKLRLEKYIVC